MLNLPNLISLSRIPLLYICVGSLFFRLHWGATIGFIVFCISAWTDWLDGYIARRYKMTSTFGAFIDALTDKIFMLGVMTTMLSMHILPEWSLFLVLLIFTRELLITGLRAVAATYKLVIPAQKEGKIKTVFQMVSTACLLLWYALRFDFADAIPEDKVLWIYYLGFSSFIIATFLTLSSGITYIKRFKSVLKDM